MLCNIYREKGILYVKKYTGFSVQFFEQIKKKHVFAIHEDLFEIASMSRRDSSRINQQENERS